MRTEIPISLLDMNDKPDKQRETDECLNKQVFGNGGSDL